MALLDGTILISADRADLLFGGTIGPAVAIDPTTGATLASYTSGDPANGVVPYSTVGDQLPGGIWAVAAENITGNGEVDSIAVYDSDVMLIANITSIFDSPGSQIVYIRGDHASLFYVAVLNGTIQIFTVSNTGVASAQLADLGTNNVIAFAASYDGTIGYWITTNVSPFVVHRHDLINDLPLSDLVTGPASSLGAFDGMFVLPDGTILVTYRDGAGDPVEFIIKTYTTGGVEINTVSLGTTILDAPPELGIDPDDDTHLWAKVSSIDRLTATITEFNLSDLSIDHSFVVNTLDGTGDVPVSCPLLIFGGAVAAGEAIIGPLVWVHWPRVQP